MSLCDTLVLHSLIVENILETFHLPTLTDELAINSRRALFAFVTQGGFKRKRE